MHKEQLREIADKVAKLRQEDQKRVGKIENPQRMSMLNEDINALTHFELGLRVALDEAEPCVTMRFGTVKHYFHTSQSRTEDDQGELEMRARWRRILMRKEGI